MKKKILIVSISICLIGIIVAIVCLIKSNGKSIKKITLQKKSIEIEVGVNYNIGYRIDPSDQQSVNVEWKSSDDTIATVEKGTVIAKNAGECTITAIAGDKEDNATVIVTFNLTDIYHKYCNSDWAYLSSDGSYMTIDTNPKNIDDYVNKEAYSSLSVVNSALNLPNSLFEKMCSTRAIDGRQKESYENITVSWTYHPDHGIEVMYEKTK